MHNLMLTRVMGPPVFPLMLGAALLIGGCAPPPELPGADSTAATPGAGGGPRGAALDPERLDRTAPSGPCGYPGPGPMGYGTELGQRVDNSAAFELVTCDGETKTLADFMCERDAGGYNAGILLNIGAGWCGPCLEETLEFPALYEEYRGRGIELVQVMFQDWSAQRPTQSFCADWRDGNWRVGGGDATENVGVQLEFPVLLDQVNDWTSVYLQDPQAATPVNLLFDANGNIRWKLEGQKPDAALLRAQLELVLSNPYGA